MFMFLRDMAVRDRMTFLLEYFWKIFVFQMYFFQTKIFYIIILYYSNFHSFYNVFALDSLKIFSYFEIKSLVFFTLMIITTRPVRHKTHCGDRLLFIKVILFFIFLLSTSLFFKFELPSLIYHFRSNTYPEFMLSII